MITPAQVLRLFRLPFSHGGRNALFWQLIDRGQRACHLAARLHRATFARRQRVVMVVGTYGKTTTTRAVAAALGLPVDPWLDANANCLGLVAWSLLRQPPWRRHVAIEAGIGEPGTMAGHAATLRPEIVVVTCLGAEHLQSFRDPDHLRSEKAEAVRALPPSAIAILNADDPNVRWMATQTQARVIRYGSDPACDVHLRSWSADWPHGSRVEVVVAGRALSLRTRLHGRNSLSSLLAAFAVGLAEDLPLELVAGRLASLPPTPGRLEPILLPSGAIVLCDDYKGTFETVHAALDVLASLPAPRKFVVLGGLDAPPNPQRPVYRAVAEHAARVADHLIITGPGNILRAYTPGLPRSTHSAERVTTHEHAPRPADAARLLSARLAPGDIVLLKGQQHQHLRRILLALQGRSVRCAVDACRLHLQSCDTCPLLDRPSPLGGLRKDERVISTPLNPIDDATAPAIEP